MNPTPEQYANAQKLIQTLRDISDLEFFMPSVTEEFDSPTWWSFEYGNLAYGESRAAEIIEEQADHWCGKAACVAGWAIHLGIIPNTRGGFTGYVPNLAKALGLSEDQVFVITDRGMDMTREEKAKQLEATVERNMRKGIPEEISDDE